MASFSYKGLYRPEIAGGSRCRVPRKVCAVDAEVAAAFKEAEALARRMHSELTGVLTTIGVNGGMSRLLAAIAKCFDWRCLPTFQSPTYFSLGGISYVRRVIEAVSLFLCMARGRGVR